MYLTYILLLEVVLFTGYVCVCMYVYKRTLIITLAYSAL